jgi:hypothetical protein
MTKVGTRGQDKRLWIAGGAVLAVLIVLIGWFVVIDPQLSAASSTRDQADSARTQNLVLEAKNSRLEEQNNDAAALRAGLAAALAELPTDGGLPEFTRQLSAQATATSVVLSSVVVGTATPVEDAADTAVPGTTTDAVTTATPASGLVQMTVSLAATGLAADLQAFLHEIQVTGPRRALVTSTQLTPSSDDPIGIDGPCTLNLTLNIFSAPVSATDQAALDKLLSGN